MTGTYSTGKTTLARACIPMLERRFGDAFGHIPEVARAVIARGHALDRAATAEAYMLYMALQLRAERGLTGRAHLLSDRSLIDLVAYVRVNKTPDLPAAVVDLLEEVVRLECRYFDRFCYLPIEFPLEADGVRTDDETYRAEVDRMLREVHREYGVAVTTISGSPMARRRALLACFGVTPS